MAMYFVTVGVEVPTPTDPDEIRDMIDNALDPICTDDTVCAVHDIFRDYDWDLL